MRGGKRQEQRHLGEVQPVEEDREAVQGHQLVARLGIHRDETSPDQRGEAAKDDTGAERKQRGPDHGSEEPTVAERQSADTLAKRVGRHHRSSHVTMMRPLMRSWPMPQ